MSSPSTKGGAALLLLLAASAVLGKPALDCNPALCVLPDCRCSSTETPGSIYRSNRFITDRPTPHFVTLTFDGAVTRTNYPFYQELQELFTDRNGCRMKMTFFVSHENTDYSLVNALYRNGHEIAVHTVTKKPDVENYWRNLTKEGWLAEIQQQKQMLEIYGKIPGSEIKGFRAPYLEVGGNEMYGALQEAGFRYDSSWPTLHYTTWYSLPGAYPLGNLWPYTLDYASVQEQTVGTKPTDSFPGLWVAPMTSLRNFEDVPCSTLDACVSAYGDELETSSVSIASFLTMNYRNHFIQRTPHGIYASSSWFNTEIRKEGLRRFLTRWMSGYSEAYVVTMSQMLDWVQNPVPISELGNHPSFQCSDPLPNTECATSDNVNCVYHAPLPIPNYEVYMNICQGPCPANYPYLNNVNGTQPYPLGSQ